MHSSLIFNTPSVKSDWSKNFNKAMLVRLISHPNQIILAVKICPTGRKFEGVLLHYYQDDKQEANGSTSEYFSIDNCEPYDGSITLSND